MTKQYKDIRHFLKALSKMETNVRQRGLKNAVEAGGRVIEANAKINIVNTFKDQTGNLANSIIVDVTATPDEATALIGPTAIYGRIQELGGTVKPLVAKELHWIDENGEHHRAKEVTLPARPYLAPAANDHKTQILEAMAETLRIEIEGAL